MVDRGEGIEYEPRSVKEVLVDMKDTSELMVDLAYSAVLFKNDEIAKEVLELEDRMNVLRYHANMSLMLAARKPKDAEQLVGIAQIVGAAEKIANAADDIASILIREIGLPDELRSALPEARETILRAEVDEVSEIAGKSLGDLNLETDTGVHIIAIKRDTDWIFDPDKETQVLRGDTLFGEGPDEGVERVYERATRTEFEDEGMKSSEIENLDRAVAAIVEMKDMSELAVGLGYSAALFDDEEIAGEVQVLESKADSLKQDLEEWVLESASDVPEPKDLRGLLHLAAASEVISDAALEMADAVMRDVEMHPVLAEAVKESNEIITSIVVEEGSELDSRSLGEVLLEIETGMHVMAIRREDDDWVYNPTSDDVLEGGDTLIARGTRKGRERLEKMADAEGGI
ncbi:MAG: TrkA C-terminal domain-containing protein [Halobacteria archaeon]|nr:TrkA C-terminal domain-containing protein [Halobacteria archaeon]